MSGSRIKLFDGIDEDANSTETIWSGLPGHLVSVGTWGSGTVKVQYSPDSGTTWLDVKDDAGENVALTANGMAKFDAPQGHVRLVLSGSTDPDLIAWVIEGRL